MVVVVVRMFDGIVTVHHKNSTSDQKVPVTKKRVS
jgi:hypothetical protein